MKEYAVEVLYSNNPKFREGEDPTTYFPPPSNVIQMLRYKNRNEISG
jgi:hypothetical protein